jgi:hypothetical protein
VVLSLVGCAPQSTASPTVSNTPPPQTSQSAPSVGALESAPKEEPAAPQADSPGTRENEEPSEALLFPGGVFPPADPGAPYERSKKESDGVWRSFFFGHTPDHKLNRARAEVSEDFGSEWVKRIVIHPHEASRFQTLTVAAFDLRYLRVAHRPGKKDVQDVGHPELAESSGIVPASEQVGLFAVFNGGFQPRHGRWGMLSLGTQLVPARDDACTVGVTEDGAIQIGPWLSMKDKPLVAYRQTPPCLVSGGKIHPKLEKPDRKPWAGQHKDRKTRRRSVVGISADGRTLFVGVGGETEPEVLAAGMVHLGAQAAAQLDINWNWTRVFLFDQKDSAARDQGALIEDMAKDKGEYVSRASSRGFFYLVHRDGSANSGQAPSK